MLKALWNRFITILRPDKVLIEPSVDFREPSETLQIHFEANVHGRSVKISKKVFNAGKGLFTNRNFRIAPNNLKTLSGALKGCEWIDDWTVICQKSNIPQCLTKLRENPPVKQSAAAASVRIHSTPIQSQTYLELNDPETLIVRQNFASSEGHIIQAPDLQPAQWPEWLNISGEFFKMPTERAPQPKRGAKSLLGNLN